MSPTTFQFPCEGSSLYRGQFGSSISLPSSTSKLMPRARCMTTRSRSCEVMTGAFGVFPSGGRLRLDPLVRCQAGGGFGVPVEPRDGLVPRRLPRAAGTGRLEPDLHD